MFRLVGLAGMVVLSLAVVPAGGASSRIATPSLATLLARHVPILVLHPQELFQPAPVDGFLADSDLERRTPSGWEKVSGPLPKGGADLRLNQRYCSAREGIAAASCYANAQAKHEFDSAPVVYGAAFRRGTRIALQYWLWYPYDDYSPTVPVGDLWQVHEGDWEAVSVILDLRGTPLIVGCSQHGAGRRRDWAKAPKRGLRPLVYVALGSHANYFTPGTQRFDPRVVDPLFISIIKQNGGQPVDHTGRGRIVRPRLARVTATSPSWMAFAGTWGEDEYIHVPGGQPVVVPGGAGPRGPAFHEQWRRPIGDVLSWPAS